MPVMMKFPSSPSSSPTVTTPRTSRQSCTSTPRSTTPRRPSRGVKRRTSKELTSRESASPPLTPPESSRSSRSSSTISGFVLGRRTSEHATRSEQLEEMGRLLAELIAADVPDTSSARLGACVMLLRAEAATPGRDTARIVAPPSVPSAQADVQFTETVGNATVAGGAVLRYTGYFSEAPYDIAEWEAGKAGEPIAGGRLASGKASGATVDVQADTLRNELRFRITDGEGGRGPWQVAIIRKKPVPLPATFAPVVRLGKHGDAVELLKVQCYLPGGVIREQLAASPLGVIVPELERALSLPDPSLMEHELGAAREKMAEAKVVQDLAEKGDGCPFLFLDAAALRQSEAELPLLLPMQELHRRHPEWYHTELLTLEDACSRTLAVDHVAVSHRWDESSAPDPSGVQLAAIRAYLRERLHVTRVWIDYCCMPQSTASESDTRTAEERQLFALMLKNVNLLFLGVNVLILTDRSYLSRFWTNFEAWLAMQDVSRHGLVTASSASLRSRCTITCVHGAPEALIESLIEEWSDCTAAKAYQKLSAPDVQVTNQSDKDVQLPKILLLDERVSAVALRKGIDRAPSPDKFGTRAASWQPEDFIPAVERRKTF